MSNSDVDDAQETPRSFRSNLSRRLLVTGRVMALLGAFLVFLPDFINPANWSSSPAILPRQYAFVFDLVYPGLLIFIVGTVLLLYSLFAAMRRSEAYYAERRNVAFGLYKKSLVPTVVGAIVYLVMTPIQSLLMPVPQALKSSVVPVSVQSVTSIFLGGCIVAFCVSYYCYLYSSRISPNSVVVRGAIYSAFALFIVTGLLSLGNLHDVLNYFLLSIATNSPRYLVLGLAVGATIQKRSSDAGSES